MIQHIMLWNYNSNVPPEERTRLKAEFERLPDLIGPLRGIQWGPVIGGRNQQFSHCFVMLFDDTAGLAEYASHPEHLRVAASFKAACEVQVVVDFEVIT